MKLRPRFFSLITKLPEERQPLQQNGTAVVRHNWFSRTVQVAATLRPIEVVWSRMSGIAQSLSPRAAIHLHSLRASIPCQRQCTIRKAPRRTFYDTRYGTPSNAEYSPRARRNIWVTTSSQRVGPRFLR